VYILLDYGDFIDGSTTKTAAPFVQLLSTTDPAAAHADFVATRLGGTDANAASHTANHQGNGSQSGGLSKSKIAIFIGAGVAVAALIAGVVASLLRRRKASYRKLFEPAPQGDMQLHYVTGYNTGGQYADPWNRR
jgi:hypothetical protein